MQASNKLKVYYFTAIFSLVFSVVAFTYNTWRMEVSETNTNVRTASFKVLENLSALEQNIYARYYDQDEINGSARVGWIKLGLIVDLSTLISDTSHQNALNLHQYWSANWQNVAKDEQVVNELVLHIDAIRATIKERLAGLNDV